MSGTLAEAFRCCEPGPVLFSEERSAEVVARELRRAPRTRGCARCDLPRPPPARVRQGRRADRGGVGGGDRLPDPHRAEVRRRTPGVHPALRRAGGLDAGRDDQPPDAGGTRPSPRCSGPFHVVESPPRELGDDIALDGKGDAVPGPRAGSPGPTATPIPGASVDVWQANDDGLLRRAAARRAARAQPARPVHRRRRRPLLVPDDRAAPLPDPGRRPGRRAARGDRPAPVPAGAHPLHRPARRATGR